MNPLAPRGGVVAGQVTDLELARTVGVFVTVTHPAVLGARFASTLAGMTPIPIVNSYLRRDADGRGRWWVVPVGAVSTVAVAWPGALGVAGRVLPVQPYLGFANQTLVVLGAAAEHGVNKRNEQIDLVARVLAQRQINTQELIGENPGWAQLVPIGATAEQMRGGIGPAVSAVRDVVHAVRSAGTALKARPRPAQAFDLLGRLPMVGAVASYVGEFATLRAIEIRASDGAKILGLEAILANPSIEGEGQLRDQPHDGGTDE